MACVDLKSYISIWSMVNRIEDSSLMTKLAIKTKVTDDSKTKLKLLFEEFNRFQQYFNGETCYNPSVKDKAARKTQGLFQRASCIMDMNADYNGSMNIMQRALGLLSNVGGLLTNSKLIMIVDRNK